jgi:hypothetical protein
MMLLYLHACIFLNQYWEFDMLAERKNVKILQYKRFLRYTIPPNGSTVVLSIYFSFLLWVNW